MTLSALNATSIWGSFDTTNLLAGGVVVIDPTTLNPSVDNQNFAWKTSRLYLGNQGDFSGIDTLNVKYKANSYVPQSEVNLGTGVLAGFKVSTSGGTSSAQTPVADGNLIGMFSGFAGYNYLGASSIVYVEQAGFRTYVKGPTVTNPGGRIAVAIKGDAVNLPVEAFEFSFTGTAGSVIYNFKPVSDGVGTLGVAGAGFEKFFPQSMGATAPTNGSQTISKIAGKFKVAAGSAADVVITNTKCTANSIVVVSVMSKDATLKNPGAVVAAAGSFTYTPSVAPTADCIHSFFLISQD